MRTTKLPELGNYGGYIVRYGVRLGTPTSCRAAAVQVQDPIRRLMLTSVLPESISGPLVVKSWLTVAPASTTHRFLTQVDQVQHMGFRISQTVYGEVNLVITIDRPCYC